MAGERDGARARDLPHNKNDFGMDKPGVDHDVQMPMECAEDDREGEGGERPRWREAESHAQLFGETLLSSDAFGSD